MANQAIALQARTPQTDILGGAIQRNAQMMNMMAQQSAAERQAMQAQQAMELARAEEGRAVTKAELEARKANQEYIASRVKYFNDQLPSVKDDAGWNNWLNRVAREDNEYADELRRMSGGRYDPDFVSRVSMDAKTFIDKTIPTPEASLQYGEGGGAFGITVGGAGAPTAREVIVQPSAGAPAQTPMSAFPTPGAPATDAQIDEAARKILRSVSDPFGVLIEFAEDANKNKVDHLKQFKDYTAKIDELRVWDSNSEVRFFVIPEMPKAWANLSKNELRKRVTRNAMLGAEILYS